MEVRPLSLTHPPAKTVHVKINYTTSLSDHGIRNPPPSGHVTPPIP